jgi:septum formation protein
MFPMNSSSRPVVLASASPRRRELLAKIVPDFEVMTADVDEEALTVADPWETAERLAQAKARKVATLRPDARVIAGDTVVALPDGTGYEQLAKPASREDAARILSRLSGRTHLVITGICIFEGDRARTFSATSRVTFRDLDQAQIDAYVATGEPMDKAGAYAIQGGAADFVERLEGSFDNVVGLPVEALREELA